MRKRIYLSVMNLFLAAILMTGCGGRSQVKSLNADFDSIVIDTTATTAEGDVCKVHLKIHVFKGAKAVQLNDSLLRMGIFQPDYMAISFDTLNPQSTLPQFVRKLIADQQEVFKGIRRQEPDAKPLLYDYGCDTQVFSGPNGGYVYVAKVRTDDGTGEPTTWIVARNITPEGHWIKLEEIFGKEELKQLPAQIMEQLADDLSLDDTLAVRKAGYFTGINAYPTSNFMLFNDSIRFVYVPGEAAVRAINITLKR